MCVVWISTIVPLICRISYPAVADGKGFFTRDMGFENKAEPEGQPAVALRSGSDCSVFYNCSLNGYQDTLYTHLPWEAVEGLLDDGGDADGDRRIRRPSPVDDMGRR